VIWDSRTKEIRQRLGGHKREIFSSLSSPQNFSSQILTLLFLLLLLLLLLHSDWVMCLQCDDKKIVSGSWDHSIKEWTLGTGKVRQSFLGHTSAVTCLQYDGDRLVSGSGDKTVRIWSFQSGECLHVLSGS